MFAYLGIDQETTSDMTPEQLAIMWSHFRVLDSDRERFEKPPSTWKPPQFRDMTENELNAYWNGFREIMARQPVVKSSDAEENAIMNSEPPTSDASLVAVSSLSGNTAVKRRIRGKTSPALLAVQAAGGKDTAVVKKHKPSRGVQKKRKYDQKVTVSRKGKNASVSIWTKVQLFKESHRSFSTFC